MDPFSRKTISKSVSPTRNGDTTGIDSHLEFPVFVEETKQRTYRVFLDNHLDSPQDVRYIVQALAGATEEDAVVVHVNSGGGNVHTGLAFLQATQNCKAPIHYIGSGCIASMAAIILSTAESFELEPFTSVMFHSCSFGTYGESIDNVRYSQFEHKQSAQMLKYYAIGILSPEELEAIVERKDVIWLTAEEFYSRWERKQKLLEQLGSVVEDTELSPEEATPAKYIEIMENLFEEKPPAKKVPRAKKPARKLVE